MLFGILFIYVFICINNDVNLRVTRRFFISLKIVWIIMFTGLDPVNAKDNPIIPGTHGFKPPISRPNLSNPKFNNPALGGARQNTKSPNQCQNPNYFNQPQKKKKNSRHVSNEQVIQAYQDFISKIKKKGYEVNVAEDRFIELPTNPQTGKFDEKSIFEIGLIYQFLYK